VKDERESSGIGLAFSDLSRYQFYHDIVRRGQYIWVVQSMHAKYGPIVRINPSELHICNSSFYDTLYAAGGTQRKREKWAWDNVGAAGVADSTLSTIDHDRHRMRRSAIAPFFSTQNVRKLQPVIQAKVDTLFQRLMDLKATGNPVNLSYAFSALTNGIVDLPAEALLLATSMPEIQPITLLDRRHYGVLLRSLFQPVGSS